jgi:hypothetical protein
VSATDLLAAMGRIRVAAEDLMDERDLAQLGWTEEAVTEVCIHRGLPEVQVVQFNKKQEGGGVGADYLWWWLDSATTECFGMLVQAKRMTWRSGRWAVDISHRKGKQFGDLMRTAHFFRVPAIYGVYTGGLIYRQNTACRHGRDRRDCLSCRRMAISLIGAYLVEIDWEIPTNVGALVYNFSVPLEDLVDPALPAGAVLDLNLKQVTGPLREFLIHDQKGPREVAKRIFKEISAYRTGSYRAVMAESMSLTSDPVFPEVPRDRGHFRASYYEHFLGGLRTRPPFYVQDALEQRELPAEITDLVDGLVIATF